MSASVKGRSRKRGVSMITVPVLLLVEMRGLEPLTSNLQSWRSTN